MKRLLLLLLVMVGASSSVHATSYMQTIHWASGGGWWDKDVLRVTGAFTVTGDPPDGNYVVGVGGLGYYTVVVAASAVVSITQPTLPTFDAQGSGAYEGESRDWDFVALSGFTSTTTLEGDTHVHITRQDAYTGYTGTLTYMDVTHHFIIAGPASSACSWSLDWNLLANCPGGTVTTHDIGVLVNGSHWTGSPATVPPGQTLIEGGVGGTHSTGTTIVLQVDGATVATHTVTCPVDGEPEPPSNVWVFNGDLAETCEGSPTPAPTSTPAPTPGVSPTPGASPSPWPTPGAPPSPGPSVGPPPGPTAPPGGSPGANGNVNVLNTSDFYAPVLKALQDLQSEVAPPPDNGNSGGAMGDGPPTADALERGDLDNLKGKVEQIRDKKTEIVGDLQGKIDAFGTVIDTLPTSFGTVSSIPIPFDAFGAVTASAGDAPAMALPSVINLTPWLSSIAIVRLVLLWILRCVFWIKVIQLFAAQGSSPKAIT